MMWPRYLLYAKVSIAAIAKLYDTYQHRMRSFQWGATDQQCHLAQGIEKRQIAHDRVGDRDMLAERPS